MRLLVRSHWLLLSILVLLPGRLFADSVTLKSGEKVTGTIKAETDTEIVIDVPVSASITDERVVQKADIAKVDKAQPDQIAYQQLIQIQPNPQYSYASQAYDQILANLDQFQATYPNSSYVPEIRRLRDAFQDEKRHVDAGQFKYLGRWLSRDEALRRRIQIEGMQVYASMEKQAAAGDFVGAMQTFASIEQDYATTRIYPAAISLAQKVLISFQQDLDVRMRAVKADQEQLKNTIAFTSEPEKSEIISQEKAENDRDEAIIAQAVQSGAKWVPLIPRSELSVDTLQKTASSEASSLSNAPVAAMEASIAKVDAARTAVEERQYSVADGLLKDAKALWAKNEDADYLAGQLQVDMATPTPKPVTPTPKPTPTPRPTPHPVIAIAATPTPAPIEEKPFYETLSGILPIGAGLLIVVGVVGSYIQKKTRKQQQVAE